MWLNKLKVAVVEEDIDLLASLLEDIPQLKDAKEREHARYLLDAAKKIVQELQDSTALSMLHIQKNKEFLKATRNMQDNRLDITS
jgi:predicted sugar kinase